MLLNSIIPKSAPKSLRTLGRWWYCTVKRATVCPPCINHRFASGQKILENTNIVWDLVLRGHWLPTPTFSCSIGMVSTFGQYKRVMSSLPSQELHLKWTKPIFNWSMVRVEMSFPGSGVYSFWYKHLRLKWFYLFENFPEMIKAAFVVIEPNYMTTPKKLIQQGWTTIYLFAKIIFPLSNA